MTDQERIELREWSARLMGWEDYLLDYFDHSDSVGTIKIANPKYKDWAPDLPSSPASQILSVVEKLEEDRAEIIIHKTQTKVFYQGCWYWYGGEGRLLNTLKAMYLTAKTTGVVE